MNHPYFLLAEFRREYETGHIKTVADVEARYGVSRRTAYRYIKVAREFDSGDGVVVTDAGKALGL